MKRLFPIFLVVLLFVSPCLFAQTNTTPDKAITNSTDKLRILEQIKRRGATTNATAEAQAQAPGKPAVPTLPALPALPAIPTTGPGQPPAGAANPAGNKPNLLSKDKKNDAVPALNFQKAELFVVLETYADLVGRTILRPDSLPNVTISIKTQTELTREEVVQALDTVFALNGIVVAPMGEKFVTIVPIANAGGQGVKFSNLRKENADQLPEAAQYTTMVVQLEHSKPSEVVPAIQPFAQNAAGIVPIDSSGVIVLRDYAINIKRMVEIINKVDIVVPLEVEMEMVPIKYALAADVANVLSSLTSGGGGGGSSGSSTNRNRTALRSNLSGSSTTGNTYTPPGAAPAGGTGIGGAGAGGASSFQNRLQQIVNRAATPGGNAPILGDAKILSDDRTNSLLIFGTAAEREMVKNIIKQLDVVQAQVLIEAIILEVSLNGTHNLGFSYGQINKGYGGGYSGSGGVNNGSFSSIFNGSNLSALTGTNAPSASNLPSGFSYFGNLGNSWQAALTAIATDSSVNVLSRPRIQTSHAVQADLFVGDTVPYVTGTYFGGINSSASSQYQQKDIGISLSVLPLINQEGLVVMDINQNIEQLGASVPIDGNNVPTTTKRQASARVAVRDGDTIILGGFISSNKTDGKSGVPYLKDIPVLGALFRSSTKTSTRTELIVLLRPTVLPNPEFAALTATKETDKLSAVKLAEKQLREEEERLHKQAEIEIKKANAIKAREEAEEYLRAQQEEKKNAPKPDQK